MLLVLGFFTCGFQLLFITVHLPAYLVDRGLSVDAGAWALGVIGLFNIIGSVTSGWLGDRMPKRYLLSIIYIAALGRGDRLHQPAGDDRLGASSSAPRWVCCGCRRCRRPPGWWH